MSPFCATDVLTDPFLSPPRQTQIRSLRLSQPKIARGTTRAQARIRGRPRHSQPQPTATQRHMAMAYVRRPRRAGTPCVARVAACVRAYRWAGKRACGRAGVWRACGERGVCTVCTAWHAQRSVRSGRQERAVSRWVGAADTAHRPHVMHARTSTETTTTEVSPMHAIVEEAVHELRLWISLAAAPCYYLALVIVA
jgi:hypothetical protein